MRAVILAGGEARRMGGGDKPLRALGQGAILDHVIARIAPQTTAIALSANGDPTRFARFNLPVLADAAPGHGPLAGILAGLRWAAAAGAPTLLTAPGDTPFLPVDLAARLEAAGAPIAHASSGGRDHPAIALIATTFADHLAAYLASGQRRLGLWMQHHQAVRVEWQAGADDPFLNINTPADLAAAEFRLAAAR